MYHQAGTNFRIRIKVAKKIYFFQIPFIFTDLKEKTALSLRNKHYDVLSLGSLEFLISVFPHYICKSQKMMLV